MRQTRLFLILLAGLLATSLRAPAASPAPENETEIRAIVQSQSDAWNRGDAEAFAANYVENGSFTNVIGLQIYGRQGFVAQHAKIFSTIYKGSRNSLSVTKIIFLRPDVAVVNIDGALLGATSLPPGLRAGPDGALHVKLQEVMTKEKGKWWIAAFHNVAVYPLPPAQ